jgi:TRAP-type C4-dicarboxylate transport system substrate-binding protein
MNLKKWKALTQKDQEIFNKTADEVMTWANLEMASGEMKERQDIISKGGKVYDLTSEEKRIYTKSTYEMWPEVRKAGGPIGNKLADILEKYKVN